MVDEKVFEEVFSDACIPDAKRFMQVSVYIAWTYHVLHLTTEKKLISNRTEHICT